MDSSLRIIRETEFYQGYIRFKMSVSNESRYVVNDITLDFIFDEKLLYIAEYDGASVKNGRFVLGNIYGGKAKSITILFEPLSCAKSSDIKCQISYADHEGTMASVFMEPKEIKVICPILKTESDINIGRLKEFINNLPSRDSRMYEVKSGFDVKKLAALAREAVEKHDVRHIRTLHTRDGQTCEIWYYGNTKVTKDAIVLRISLLAEERAMELFAATRSAEALTGLLAEVGSDLKQVVEERASGRGRVVNVHIKDSPVQRSNVATVDEEARQRREEEKREEAERLRREQEERRKREEQRKAQEAARLQAEEAEKKRKAEQEARNPAPSRPAYTPAKSRSLTPEEPQSNRKPLLVLVLLVLLVGGLWLGIFGSFDNNNVTDPVTEVSTQDLETYTNSIGMEFVLIPAGEFEMGSPSDEEDRGDEEGPVHEVTIEQVYYLGTYEVTQEQWVEVMGDNPSDSNKGDNYPVEDVSWNDVQEFVEKLNEMEGTDKYRLPSEAEWEYACQAGTTTRYSFGDDESDLSEYGWYEGNSGRETHPVGQKLPNPWGLYDMHGNVYEWVQDRYHNDYEGAPTDGSAWESGSSSARVSRGGSWLGNARYCRSTNRDLDDPGNRLDYLGFRLLRAV